MQKLKIKKKLIIFFTKNKKKKKKPFGNFIFGNYLCPFISIYINQITQQLNLPNTFA